MYIRTFNSLCASPTSPSVRNLVLLFVLLTLFMVEQRLPCMLAGSDDRRCGLAITSIPLRYSFFLRPRFYSVGAQLASLPLLSSYLSPLAFSCVVLV